MLGVVRGETRSLPLEIWAVWLLYLADAVAIFVTYTRVPARELYHVSNSGLEGGASRVLVFSNYSAALVAIVVLAILADRFPSRATAAVAVAGVVLSAAVFWPGVVDQGDLDARPVNAIAATGVLAALLLTLAASRGAARSWAVRQPGDRVRVAAAVCAVVAGLPWIAAELGLFLDGVPLLDRIYQTGKLEPESPTVQRLIPTVHHGHHHGLDAVLLLATALLLSRTVPGIRRRALRIAVGLYLSLMVAYAVGNIANDAWGEQVVKRSWTTWRIPDVVQPKASIAWALIVAGTAAVYAGAVWWRTRDVPEEKFLARPDVPERTSV